MAEGYIVTSLERDRFNAQDTNALQLEVLGHSLLISQDPNSRNPGTTVWDSSMVFAKFLERNCRKGEFSPSNMASKRTIELGAGCGIAGLAMALLGSDVVMTDQAEVLPLLLKNSERISSRIKLESLVESTTSSTGSIEVAELSWGNPDHIAAVSPPFDYIIGTDIVYADEHVEPLVETMLALSGPKTTVLLAYEFRLPAVTEKLLSLCQEHFKTKTVPRKKMDPNFFHPNIQILMLERRR